MIYSSWNRELLQNSVPEAEAMEGRDMCNLEGDGSSGMHSATASNAL